MVNDAGLLHLDPGERAAITLAQSNPDRLLLIDDLAGRIEATRRRIRTTGTLGVLRAAALRELVDLPTALARLLETNFRVSMSSWTLCWLKTLNGDAHSCNSRCDPSAEQLGKG